MPRLTTGSLERLGRTRRSSLRSRRWLRSLCLVLMLGVASAQGEWALEYNPSQFNESEGGETEVTSDFLRVEAHSARRATRVERRLKTLILREAETLFRSAAHAMNLVDVGPTYGHRLNIRQRRLLL